MPLSFRTPLSRLTCSSLVRRSFATEARLASDHVRIVEVGPRDGLQNEKKSISLETKLELIEKLAQTGVTTIEAGSFVPAKWVPQVSQNSSNKECKAEVQGTSVANQRSYYLLVDGEHVRNPSTPPPKTTRIEGKDRL
jgi:hypothetical protein